MYPYDIDRIHMNTPGYTRILKNVFFRIYTKIHVGYGEIQFKSNPPPNPTQHGIGHGARATHVKHPEC